MEAAFAMIMSSQPCQPGEDRLPMASPARDLDASCDACQDEGAGMADVVLVPISRDHMHLCPCCSSCHRTATPAVMPGHHALELMQIHVFEARHGVVWLFQSLRAS